MKKLLYIVLIGIVLIIGGWFVYPMLQMRYFPTEKQKKIIARFPAFQGITIRNDLNEAVFFERIIDGKVVGDYYEKGSMQTTQGPVRIFIPEKKGWYSIEYPYPYPLTEQKSWFIFGPRLLVVNLSSLIASVQTGQVEVAGWTDEKKDIASDIKVTFESGEGPKEKK